jgi:hypothetical protein
MSDCTERQPPASVRNAAGEGREGMPQGGTA